MSERTWFAGSIGNNWKPQDGGLNELFKLQVRAMRERCSLTKANLGVETGNSWILYDDLPHAQTSVYIKVSRFTWLEFERFGNYQSYLSPVFRLDFEMAEAASKRRLGHGGARVSERGDTFYADSLEIVFPQNFPWDPPNFRLRSVRGIGASHEHHLNSGDWLCILAGPNDWNGRADNVSSGLGVAFDWAAWHYLNFNSSGTRRGILSWL